MTRFLQRLLVLSGRVYKEFASDRCTILAGAVAYFVIFSLFPATLLTLAIVAHVYGDRVEAQAAVVNFVADFLPGAVLTTRGLIANLMHSHGLLNSAALVGLLWAGSQSLFYLEVAMNLAWDSTPRPWWKSRLRSMGFFLIFEALFAGYLFLSVVGLLKNFIGLLPGYEWVGADRLLSLGLWLIPFLISVLLFSALNKVLPNCDVTWRSALIGGLFTAALFEIARLGFGFYLEGFARYDALYGSIGGIFILVIWVYYGALVTMIGAEVASEVEAVYWDAARCEKRSPSPWAEATDLEV